MSIFQVKLKHKGKLLPIPVDAEEPLSSVFDYIEEAFEFPRNFTSLLVGGKKLGLMHENVACKDCLTDGAVVMLVASKESAVAEIKDKKADPLVKGIDAEERDEMSRRIKTRQLREANPWGTSQDKEFKFTKFEVNSGRLTPTPFDAEKLLKKLATDPAIVSIMKSRKWVVGVLCELDPEDADREQADKGEGDKCLLGWNRNSGARIALRLRTDDLQGFRKYDTIINTLLHELAHNVFTAHDDKFWALFAELKKEYLALHQSLRGARHLSDTVTAEDRLTDAPSRSTSGRALGGNTASDLSPEDVRSKRLKRFDK